MGTQTPRPDRPSLSDVLFLAVYDVARVWRTRLPEGHLGSTIQFDGATGSGWRGTPRFRRPTSITRPRTRSAERPSRGPGDRGGHPEAYDELEETVVPPEHRASHRYAGGYAVSFNVDDIGDLLEPIERLQPRPKESRLPSVATARRTGVARRVMGSCVGVYVIAVVS